MMTGATSLVYDAEMPPFAPIMELIPSFKRIQRKSLLSEFRVGKGRLLLCGLQIPQNDPAAQWLWRQMILYLENKASWTKDVPEWKSKQLHARLHFSAVARTGQLLDAGGRPIE